jgi:hypothetical protein
VNALLFWAIQMVYSVIAAPLGFGAVNVILIWVSDEAVASFCRFEGASGLYLKDT